MDNLLDEVQHYLLGTCKSPDEAIEHFELNIDAYQLEDWILGGPNGVEICKRCEWWHEVASLTFIEDINGGVCDQCLEDGEGEN